jgi:hypothetical protein
VDTTSGYPVLTALSKVMRLPAASRGVWLCIGDHPYPFAANLHCPEHEDFKHAELQALVRIASSHEPSETRDGAEVLGGVHFGEFQTNNGRKSYWVYFNKGAAPNGVPSDVEDVAELRWWQDADGVDYGIPCLHDATVDIRKEMSDFKAKRKGVIIGVGELLKRVEEEDPEAYVESLKELALPIVSQLLQDQLELHECEAKDMIRESGRGGGSKPKTADAMLNAELNRAMGFYLVSDEAGDPNWEEATRETAPELMGLLFDLVSTSRAKKEMLAEPRTFQVSDRRPTPEEDAKKLAQRKERWRKGKAMKAATVVWLIKNARRLTTNDPNPITNSFGLLALWGGTKQWVGRLLTQYGLQSGETWARLASP